MNITYQNITSTSIDRFEKPPVEALAHIREIIKKHKSWLFLGGEHFANPDELSEAHLENASSVVLQHTLLGG